MPTAYNEFLISIHVVLSQNTDYTILLSKIISLSKCQLFQEFGNSRSYCKQIT